jgi:hypothetical protein
MRRRLPKKFNYFVQVQSPLDVRYLHEHIQVLVRLYARVLFSPQEFNKHVCKVDLCRREDYLTRNNNNDRVLAR